MEGVWKWFEEWMEKEEEVRGIWYECKGCGERKEVVEGRRWIGNGW